MRRMMAALIVMLAAGAGVAQAQDATTGDATAGERSFGKCKACHQVGETAKNGIGPTLNGLLGRKAGSVPGYSYSAANKDSDLVWSPAVFADYIKDPKAKMPGTKMAFAGIKNEKEVTDLTAYLQQFDATGKKTGS